MGRDSGQPAAKRVRMGGNNDNNGGVPVTYHHQVRVIYLYLETIFNLLT